MPERWALVTGATGAIGPSVARALAEAGYLLRTLSLEAPDAGSLPPGADVRVGDVCDASTLRSAVSGVDAVVHLAALLHRFEDAESLALEFRRINVGGTENVVRAAEAEGVRRIVFLSTIAVYGPRPGEMMDESTTPRPDTAYGQSKLDAEQVVLSASSRGRPLGTVLRAAAIYGSRVKGNYRRLAVAIARRRFVPIGAGGNRRTVIHDRDLASAVVLAGTHPAAAGRLFNVTDGRVHTLEEIIAAIYRGLGRRPPRLYIPLFAARAAMAGCERGCRLAGVRAPLTRAALGKYTEDVAVDGTLIQRALDFRPSVGLGDGWRETVAGLEAAGAWPGRRVVPEGDSK